MDISIKHKIISILENMPAYNTNSLHTQHIVRCPYCGDSSNQDHGHFSIKVDIDTYDPIVCRCVRCDVSGLLTPTVLEELGVGLTQDILGGLRAFNKKIIKKNKFVNTTTENFIVPTFQDNHFNSIRLDYINSRLGTEFDYNKAQELKMILDLNKFLKINDIKEIPCVSSKYLYLLANNYVGFLSTNNNCITLRRITANNNLKRYVKVILNPKNINSNTFYSIPNSIQLMYTHDINIHTSEGIFDILSIYNMNNLQKKDNYYFASCGFGYLSIFKYLIYNGINTGLNMNIYSDNDKSDKDHFRYLINKYSVSCWLDKIILHRNTFIGEKDYGVRLEKIIDSKFKIR